MRRSSRVLPALAEAHPEASRRWASRISARRCIGLTGKIICREAQERDLYDAAGDGDAAAEAYDKLVRGRVESIEIDDLMGRTLAVMLVPYPPGIPLIMPGERITDGNQVDPGLSALRPRFRSQVPGVRNGHSRSTVRINRRRQALSGGLHRCEGETMIPRDVKSPTIPIPFHKLLKVIAIVDDKDPQNKELLDHIAAENIEIEVEQQLRPRYVRGRSGGCLYCHGRRRASGASAQAGAIRPCHRFRYAALGASLTRTAYPTWPVLGQTGEVDGYIYLGQQTPAFYAKQVIASLVKYGKSYCHPSSAA